MDHIKLIACQAYSINLYRNIRTKIMKCCANIYFNQQCLIRILLCLLTDFYYNILIQHNGMDHIKKILVTGHILIISAVVIFLDFKLSPCSKCSILCLIKTNRMHFSFLIYSNNLSSIAGPSGRAV